jgi:hypothetical protein
MNTACDTGFRARKQIFRADFLLFVRKPGTGRHGHPAPLAPAPCLELAEYSCEYFEIISLIRHLDEIKKIK